MNTNHEDDDAREIHEAQLTAFALEQLQGGQREAAEELVARSEKARRQVEETAALAGQVRHAYEATPALEPSAPLREAVERQLQAQATTEKPTVAEKLVRSRGRSPMLWVFVTSVCAALLVVSVSPSIMRMRRIARNESPTGFASVASCETSESSYSSASDTFAKRDLSREWDRTYNDERPSSAGPGTEQYDSVTDNPFRSVARQPLSTFSIDVDTASYANVRRFLSEGRLPPADAVRIEEMVNYFQYNYAPPRDSTPFAVHLETAECPWRPEHRLVRIGLKGREIDRRERGPSNLVFLLDVSGSMNEPNKLPLVKQAMRMLVEQLEEDDRVAIVTYANGTGVPLPSARGNERKRILDAIDALQAGGGTNGGAGIELAYQQAAEHFVEKGANRVILCTDGDLNIGVTNDDDLVRLIKQKARTGVFLTVLGFGTGNLKDSKMEKLADRGNGLYAYIDGLREARRVLVEQMTGSLITIAKDVKIQVEFNPAQVAGYRLIGYENRVMANRDFHDDRKDAGEIGAGHTVTALYEIEPAHAEQSLEDAGAAEETLKYQRVAKAKPDRELTEDAQSGELLTVRLRYKEPDGVESRMIEFAARDNEHRFGQASADFRFASSVAAFGLVLRGSPYRGSATLAAVEEYAAAALGKDPNGYRAEFLDLVWRAKGLGMRD